MPDSPKSTSVPRRATRVTVGHLDALNLDLPDPVRRMALEAELGIKYADLLAMASQLKAKGLTFEEACAVFDINTHRDPAQELLEEVATMGIGGGTKKVAHTDRELQPLLIAVAKGASRPDVLPAVRRIQH